MHEGPTENRLGELGSLYKYYYYYYYSVTRVVICVRAFCLTDQEIRESAGSLLSLTIEDFSLIPLETNSFLFS